MKIMVKKNNPATSKTGTLFGRKSVIGIITVVMPTRMVKLNKNGKKHYQVIMKTKLKNHVRFFLPPIIDGKPSTNSGRVIDVTAISPKTGNWTTCDIDDPLMLVGMNVEITGTVKKTGNTTYGISTVESMKIIG